MSIDDKIRSSPPSKNDESWFFFFLNQNWKEENQCIYSHSHGQGNLPFKCKETANKDFLLKIKP